MSRRRFATLVSGLALAATALVGCSSSGYVQTPADEASLYSLATTVITPKATAALLGFQQLDRPIVVDGIGSSLTYGTGAPTPAVSWLPTLAKQITSAYYVPVTLNNRAVSGASIESVEYRGVINTVIADKPDLIFLETCAPNDYAEGVTAARSVATLDRVFTQLRTALPNAVVVVVVPPPSTKKGFDPTVYGDMLAQQAAWAKSRTNMVLDLSTIFPASATNVATLLNDGVHPNLAGQAVWRKAAFQLLLDSVQSVK